MRLQDMQEVTAEKKLSLHIKHLLSELFYPSQSIFLVQVCLIFFFTEKEQAHRKNYQVKCIHLSCKTLK